MNKPLGDLPLTVQREPKTLVEAIGDAIYAIRWGLVPMYLGLWVAVVAYNVWFFQAEIEFLAHLQNATATTFLLWVLDLIDVTMIANLVVMTTIGGFSTFVREFNLSKLEGKPRWMNGLDSSQLKIKTSMSLVMVSAIRLLQTFMEADHISLKTITTQLVIHVVFALTMLLFTFNARLMPKHVQHAEEPHA